MFALSAVALLAAAGITYEILVLAPKYGLLRVLIASLAVQYLVHADDLRPYYLSLLHATLPIVYYQPAPFESAACERQQKRYALIAAGMLRRQLWAASRRA